MSQIPREQYSEAIPTCVSMLSGCASHYLKRKKWETVLTLSTIMLKEVEDTLGSDSHDVGMISLVLGFNNLQLDKHDAAETSLKRAISILEKSDREFHLAVAHRFLGKSYMKIQRYEEAEISSRKALEIFEKLGDIDALMLADQKITNGELCLALNKPIEAKQLLRSGATIYARKFGISSIQVEYLSILLTTVYFWGINAEESAEFFLNSNEIADVIPLCLLGMYCLDKVSPHTAFHMYLHAVRIYESKGFLDELQMSKIYVTLGECYLEISNYVRTKVYLSKNGAFYQEKLTDNQPMMVDPTINRALCYVKSARQNEAKEIQIKNSIVKTKDNGKIGEDRIPILKTKCNAIVSTLKNLCATVRRRW